MSVSTLIKLNLCLISGLICLHLKATLSLVSVCFKLMTNILNEIMNFNKQCHQVTVKAHEGELIKKKGGGGLRSP